MHDRWAADQSPLFLDGWIAFNERAWNLRACCLGNADSKGNAIRTVVYLDSRGRIVQPPVNAYLPVAFQTTATQPYRQTRQWLAAAEPVVAEMQRRTLRGTILLTPNVTDLRPWQWAGFRVGVRYTYVVPLPFDSATIDSSVRNKIAKSARAGFVCERTTCAEAVVHCLAATEHRQQFRYGLTADRLTLAQSLMGQESLRMYLCRTTDGTPVSARVVLHRADGVAIDWLAGTLAEHLRAGVTQQLIGYVLDDLSTIHASAFDFAGADLRTVADAKMVWGGQLTPIHSIDGFGLRPAAGWLRDWRTFRRLSSSRTSAGNSAEHDVGKGD